MVKTRDCAQCAAVTSRGKRCKNRTCVTGPLCGVHTKLQQGLTVKKSSIPNAGLGLYADKAFGGEDKVVEYTGANVAQKDYDKSDGTYGMALGATGRVIDGASTQSGVARYANDCRKTNIRAGVCKGNNLIALTNKDDTRVFFKPVKGKKIRKGDELFVSYGRSYWKDRGAPTKKAKSTRKRKPSVKPPASFWSSLKGYKKNHSTSPPTSFWSSLKSSKKKRSLKSISGNKRRRCAEKPPASFWSGLKRAEDYIDIG
jgi:hypothetical protein